MSGLKQQIEKKLEKIKQMYEGNNLSQSIKDKLHAYEMFGSDVLGLLADYICIEKEELTELFDNRPSSCCDVHHAEPLEYENWICILREKLLGEQKK